MKNWGLDMIRATEEEKQKILEEVLKEKPLVNDFCEVAGVELAGVTLQNEMLLGNGFVFSVYPSKLDINLTVGAPHTKYYEVLEDEEAEVAAIIKEGLELIKRWVEGTSAFRKIVVKYDRHVRYKAIFEEIIENNNAFTSLQEISQEKTYLIVQSNADKTIKVNELFDSVPNLMSAHSYVLKSLAAISLGLIQYDIDSGEDFLEDKSSVDLTKKWVNQRLKGADLLMEASEVEELSLVDCALLKEAIGNVMEFVSGEDDFKTFNLNISDLEKQIIQNEQSEMKKGKIYFEGYEEEQVLVQLTAHHIAGIKNANCFISSPKQLATILDKTAKLQNKLSNL